MNDQDTIRKAVELADGWHMNGEQFCAPSKGEQVSSFIWSPAQYLFDALAAQLVRQYLDHFSSSVYTNWRRDTMSTIKDMVDSEVLE